jgi:hypothetical protein
MYEPSSKNIKSQDFSPNANIEKEVLEKAEWFDIDLKIH